MVNKPWIECRFHGKEGIKGYVWCMHITMALVGDKAKGIRAMDQDLVKDNIELIQAPTDTEYGLILCSSTQPHQPREDPRYWNLVCEKCLAERGWIKGNGGQAPMVTLASELPKDLDWDKAGLKRRN